MTLKALCYGPTGAILAAATTSLPFIGGDRNWDYRYCYRDACLAGALMKLGSIDEAMDLLDWLLRVIEDSEVGPEHLSPLYTVNGTALPPGPHRGAAGYAGSRRCASLAADHQVQLDVFGPVLELIHQLGEIDARYQRATGASSRTSSPPSSSAGRSPTRASGKCSPRHAIT